MKKCLSLIVLQHTGWAQINGRDELEIPVKAKLDGDYVKISLYLKEQGHILSLI